MLATATSVPGVLPDGPAWAYEVKWDGVRAMADTTTGTLRLLNRNGRDVAVAYPELAGLASVPGAVLDGEVIAMKRGVPSFELLAGRMHVRDAARAAALAARSPVSFVVFDVPVLYGVDLTRRSYDERRATLDRLELPEPAQVSPVYPDGAALWEATLAQGLEGVVAKRRSSTYQPGRRSPDWVKAPHRRTRTAVVGGWREESTGSGRLGAVLLGARDEAGRLRYLGRAGSGLAGSVGTDLRRTLAGVAADSSPFDDVVPAVDGRGTVWVRVDPPVVVDLRYLARTTGGRLRQPVVRGRRTDTTADPWEVP
jgi:bifunctional non-homologous end joining protein LigD